MQRELDGVGESVAQLSGRKFQKILDWFASLSKPNSKGKATLSSHADSFLHHIV
jgi:hypothetical protein